MSKTVLQKTLPISEIKESPVALRQVDTKSESFIGLVDSIKTRGLVNPISVRMSKENGKDVYTLVDGLHRFTACKEAGMKEVPCNVLSISESEVLSTQIIANVHKVETKPVEYSKQLHKILAANPLMTMSELATLLSKSPSWLQERLGLLKLCDRAQKLVDDGKISLTNGYGLAKLAPEEQVDWIDKAMTQAPTEFMPAINARVKEIQTAKRQGREANTEFVPVAHLRKLSELKAELEKSVAADVVIKSEGAKDVKSAFLAGVKWAVHLDTESVAAAKAKEEARKKEAADQAARRKAERAQQKAKDAAEEAAKAQAELATKK